MLVSDLFNSHVQFQFTGSHRKNAPYGDWTRHYWECEFIVAHVNNQEYSELELFQDVKNRTCGLCAEVKNTNEGGFVHFCDSEDCLNLRVFFGYTNSQNPVLAAGKIGSVRAHRVTWLKQKLAKLYDVKSIRGIPADMRVNALLSLQLERLSCEHERSKANIETANC